jgi:hypothetical protein
VCVRHWYEEADGCAQDKIGWLDLSVENAPMYIKSRYSVATDTQRLGDGDQKNVDILVGLRTALLLPSW